MVNAFTMKISDSSDSRKLLQLSDGTNTDNLVINSVLQGRGYLAEVIADPKRKGGAPV
jgi:hypothetical protein